MKTDVPVIHSYFGKKGLRLTKPRKAIIDILNHTSEHLTAEDVYIAVHKNYPAIGLTTVYRTLDLLTSWDVVHKIDFGEGKARYELADGAQGIGHHHHLICISCKEIIDYNDFQNEEVEFIKKVEDKLAAQYNYTINNHVIEFHGICPHCREANE